jgi:ankyrin repeat protein
MQKEMIKAAKTGDLARIEELLLADAALIGATDADGSTPLHYAVWKGHQEVVVKLLEAGADVKAHNRNDHWGTTPLHAAAHANRSAIAQLLIGHGADVEAKDLSGNTPLRHTTYHNAKAAARLLRKHGATEA